MRDLDTLTFHPIAEKVVDVICRKTQNPNLHFFRVNLSYYLAKMAATMRVQIKTRDRGNIPVNLYAINLAPSGQDKGHSTNIIEDQIINQFKDVFTEQTLPVIADENLAKLAIKRANLKNEDPDAMDAAIRAEYRDLGKLYFSFDSATPAAIKQMRHKLLMAKIGAVNLEIDEIGINLLPNADVLGTFLELFDIGKIKDKLTKNTRENIRSEEIVGRTPTNALLFGTPTKLLDGGKTEETFYSFLDMGYARRCIFGYTRDGKEIPDLTAQEVYDILTDKSIGGLLTKVSSQFAHLANAVNYNKTITVSKDVSIQIIEYRMHCERQAHKMGEHEEIAKAEMCHRYFKAMKLAGAYAFIDGHSEITEDNWYAAVCMIEESGKAFGKLLTRDRNYVKLAKYVSSIGHEVTHVDLTEDLPFYRGSIAQKNDLMQLAIAWGHKHHVVIKRTTTNGIEFVSGETLKETDLNNLILAHSKDLADGYKNVQAPFNKLHNLALKPNHNWVTHHTISGHRDEDSMIPGFDMVVLDVDKGTRVSEVMQLLEEYTFLLHTTKRHTAGHHRFRVILPLNYHMALAADEFKEFMNNIAEWLPFEIDTAASQRSRKWMTHKGQHVYNEGQLLDARLFIPKTAKNDERQKTIQTYQSLTNLERWFVRETVNGNRSTQLIKYALLLVDIGYPIDHVRASVVAMSNKLAEPLPEKEIDATIMVSATKASIKKAAKAA